MNSQLNRDDTTLEIIGLRLRDVHRCHVALRQLDVREVAVNKYLVLDFSTDAALQSVLKQVPVVCSSICLSLSRSACLCLCDFDDDNILWGFLYPAKIFSCRPPLDKPWSLEHAGYIAGATSAVGKS